MNLDSTLLTSLNALVADKGAWFHILSALGNNPFIRGLPVFASLAIVLSTSRTPEARSRIFLGFVGVFLALVISVWCQSNFHLHLRPVFDSSVHIVDVLNWSASEPAFNGRIYSFPSDTAACYFAISTIVFVQDKRLGALCYLWNVVTIGVCRVAMGTHYPSDIVGGLVLALLCVYGLASISFLRHRVVAVLKEYKWSEPAYDIFVLIFAAEAYSLFPGLQEVYVFLIKLMDGNVPWLRT
jgi:membrane-associated phospholipid phosphatase